MCYRKHNNANKDRKLQMGTTIWKSCVVKWSLSLKCFNFMNRRKQKGDDVRQTETNRCSYCQSAKFMAGKKNLSLTTYYHHHMITLEIYATTKYVNKILFTLKEIWQSDLCYDNDEMMMSLKFYSLIIRKLMKCMFYFCWRDRTKMSGWHWKTSYLVRDNRGAWCMV